MRLSHSAKELYSQCPMKYKLHYIEGKRSIRTSSALVFGSALDEALNELLLSKNISAAEYVFTEKWNECKDTYVIDFFKSDADTELLTLQQAELIDQEQDAEKKWHKLCWYSLFQKGRSMLQSYNETIMPRIKNVLKVQEPISLIGQDESGSDSEDHISGIIDFIGEIELDSGDIVTAIIDNKTTSQPYPKNSVDTKEQTALYAVANPEIEYVGFATVIKKAPFKTQLLVGKPPEHLKEGVINKFVDVLNKVKSGSFEMNKKNCFAFGQKCIYYSYCNGGGFDENIITIENT